MPPLPNPHTTNPPKGSNIPTKRDRQGASHANSSLFPAASLFDAPSRSRFVFEGPF
jgi:hypothetical protein